MKAFRSMKIAALFVIVLTSASAPPVRAQYSFTVHNNTKHTIVSLVASETGEKASEFDIGDGIGPGKTATVEWDKSTDNGDCEWAFSAVYDDETYSDPVMINFCEEALALVFEP